MLHDFEVDMALGVSWKKSFDYYDYQENIVDAVHIAYICIRYHVFKR